MTSRNTFSQVEIKNFESLAKEWWNESGKFKALHKINPTRLKFILNCLSSYRNQKATDNLSLRGIKILDVGCGGGLISEPLSRLGADVTAIDAGRDTIQVAKYHAELNNLNITYIQCAPETLINKNLRFDIVISLEVIEHVTDINLFIGTMTQLLTPSGALILGTINRTIKSLVFAKVGAEYIFNWVPRGTHNWAKFLRPTELINLLKSHGLVLNEMRGVVFDPVENEWSLSSNLNINYLAWFSGKKKPQ